MAPCRACPLWLRKYPDARWCGICGRTLRRAVEAKAEPAPAATNARRSAFTVQAEEREALAFHASYRRAMGHAINAHEQAALDWRDAQMPERSTTPPYVLAAAAALEGMEEWTR